MRSKWEFGAASECRRGLLHGMGYTEEEMDKPLIAVVNSWNEYNPGHVHLKKIAERVKKGIIEKGGLPFELCTTAICDGMVLKDPKYIELPSRNLIADEVELNVEGNMLDAMVLISTCDSIVPGHLMAAARLNIPTIVVTGGYMPMGMVNGKEVSNIDAQDLVGLAQENKINMEDYNAMVKSAWGICGACGVMTTANSMCIVSEALGMSLPGNSTTSAVSPKLLSIAYEAGKKIIDLLKDNVTSRKIITKEAIENAIRVSTSVAGSTNLLLHIPAIAQEAGLNLDWWKEFDRASSDIPLLSNICPSGPYHFKHFEMAGGLPALMNTLMSKLNKDCLTVTQKTIYENVKDAQIYDEQVIKPFDSCMKKNIGIAVLYGNIAREGAIVKAAAVPKNLFKFRGPAKVFNSLDSSLNALRRGDIKEGYAVVIRYLGPKGRFGTTAFTFQEEMKGRKNLFNSCAIITDGRFSGGTSGLSIGYVSPEAALGSPLAIIEDGDLIEIDIDKRIINLIVEDNVIEKRLENWSWEFPKGKYHKFLNLFSKNISSTAKGVIWED